MHPDDLVSKMAQLAKIQLESPELRLKMEQSISAILDIFTQLESAPVGDLPPLFHPLDISQPLRADVSESASIDRTANQQSAPEVLEGLYMVPEVIQDGN